jgi:hypothetical protein
MRSMTFLLLLAVCPCLADGLPPPDVTGETLRSYTESMADTWKLAASMYAEALRAEADSLAGEIGLLLGGVPEAAGAFGRSHEAFTAHAGAQAEFSETLQWYDLSSGEAYFGSGYGETAIMVLCSLYWERVLYYREVMGSLSRGGIVDAVFPVLETDSIGGF